VPWSAWWGRNAFAESRPALRSAIESPYVRGAVTGVGVITVCAGFVELSTALALRSRRHPQP